MGSIYANLPPRASEFCGVTPFESHPNLDETIQYQLDLLDSASLNLAQLVSGQELKIEFADETSLHCAVITSPNVRRGTDIHVIKTTLDTLQSGEEAILLGATLGRSILKPDKILRHTPAEYNKIIRMYVDMAQFEDFGYTRESLLAGGDYFEDSKGVWTRRAKWLPFGAMTADVTQVHIGDPKTGKFTPYF